MLIKIFVQEKCPNCPASKELGKKLTENGLNVEFHDIKTPQGLAESLLYDVLSTPSTIILNNESVVKSFRGTTPSEDEVKSWL